MKFTPFLLILFLLYFEGCVVSQSPTENIVLGVNMTLDDFLSLNRLSFETSDEVVDRNRDGDNDLFIWDLDGDGQVDVLIDIDESFSEGPHGKTLGFNKILVYDYTKRVVWVAKIGKTSGKTIVVNRRPI